MRVGQKQARQDIPEYHLNPENSWRKKDCSSQDFRFEARKRQKTEESDPLLGLQLPAENVAKVLLSVCPPGVPPAFWACVNDDIKTLKLLIEQNVDLEDTANEDYNPPLHQALKNANIEMVKLLLDHGASLEAEDMGCYTVIRAARFMAQDHPNGDAPEVLRLVEAEAARRRCAGM